MYSRRDIYSLNNNISASLRVAIRNAAQTLQKQESPKIGLESHSSRECMTLHLSS